ncbi:MAG TPA: hypothetical protein PLL72_05725 [Burkholderiaceae bacterium]|nr:hypothetical protein [Burkholderiaceae bacterium]
MHQDRCVELAREAAVDCGERHAYMPATELLAETWLPHRWVVDAMLMAADAGGGMRAQVGRKLPTTDGQVPRVRQ